MPPDPDPDPDLGRFVKRIAIAATAVVLLAVVWIAREVLIVLFAAVLFAVFLGGLAKGLRRITGLPRGWAVLVVVIVLLGLFGGGAALWGVSAADELGGAVETLQQRLARLDEQLPDEVQETIERSTEGSDMGPTAAMGGMVRWVGYGLTVVFVGLFVVGSPGLYKAGVLAFVPRARRAEAAKIVDDIVRALGRFLIARAVAMILVGLGSGLVFWLADIPFALPLAVFGGLLTFVPYFGPIVAAIPIAVVSGTEGLEPFLIATIGYVVIQIFTGYIGDPILEQRLVAIPAALVLASQVLLGILAGPLGVAFGAPITVVGLVIGRALGVRAEPERPPEHEPRPPPSPRPKPPRAA